MLWLLELHAELINNLNIRSNKHAETKITLIKGPYFTVQCCRVLLYSNAVYHSITLIQYSRPHYTLHCTITNDHRSHRSRCVNLTGIKLLQYNTDITHNISSSFCSFFSKYFKLTKIATNVWNGAKCHDPSSLIFIIDIPSVFVSMVLTFKSSLALWPK